MRHPPHSPTQDRRVWPARWLPMMAAILISSGCHRDQAFYRLQADQEANCLVDAKAAAVGIDSTPLRIDIDPQSRMFDPNPADCEPMPPDDPTSHRLMQCVDCKKGSRCWRCLPKTGLVENPNWQRYLPADAEGKVLLDLEAAVEMALLQSPRYQSELEELYLSALDVSFERFRFDAQFFGGSSIFFTADGQDRSGTGNPSSLLEVNPLDDANRLRVERLTATGGELVVGLANSLIWQFAGPDDYTSHTLLDFSIVQPLLRSGGRLRVLERLTISERALLAGVRQMERYRRGFYLNIVTGRSPGSGPSRRGGFFGGSGLEGFSGVGAGGFGSVGSNAFGGTGGGTGVTGGAGAASAGGYLGLLQTAQEIRNQRANVVALNDSAHQLQASYEAGRIDRFQVDLTQQALYNAQSRLLGSEASYQSTLDGFKIDLGLPPSLEIKITDTMLDRMNLLDPKLVEVQQQVTSLLDTLRPLRRMDAREQQPPAPANRLANDGPEDSNLPPNGASNSSAIDRAELPPLLEKLAGLQQKVDARLAEARDDFQALQEALPDRRGNLRRLAKRPEALDAQLDMTAFSARQLDERTERRQMELRALEVKLKKNLDQVGQLSSDQEDSLGTLIDALDELSGNLLELSLTQAGIRLDMITITPVELNSMQALAIASAYRRDWMNARASLVDVWRLIYFNANNLLSGMDIVFSGDLGNVGDNPFQLRDTNGRLRVGLEFDSPMTRLAERNVYRQSLIEYQQARRSYYQFRDGVSRNLRNTLRQIRLNEVNLELRRAAVQVAISQVELTRLRLSEPPKLGETSQFGNTTARDLVQSLGDLLNVQNDLLSVWVNSQMQQLNLEFDLGIMELDPHGLRLASNIPPETYLAGLPAGGTAWCGPTLPQPPGTLELEVPDRQSETEGLTAEPVEPESGPEGIETLPLPEVR